MKQVSQLDSNGYFIGLTVADESPLEPGVYLIPGGAVDCPAPNIPEGKRAKWNGDWVFEDIPKPEPEPEVGPEPVPEPGPPQQCSGRQGQKALLRTPYSGGGNMLDAVKGLIASIPDDFDRQDAELDFNAATWERKNPTLQALWAQLGGTEAQLDDLFTLAVTL